MNNELLKKLKTEDRIEYYIKIQNLNISTEFASLLWILGIVASILIFNLTKNIENIKNILNWSISLGIAYILFDIIVTYSLRYKLDKEFLQRLEIKPKGGK